MKTRRILALAVVLSLVIGVVAMAASVTPTVIPGASNTDKTCAVVMPGTTELKVEPVPDGTYGGSDGILSVSIRKPSSQAGSSNSFDWTSNIAVLGVIVKNGIDGANWYNYSPNGSMGDTYLTTPNNGAKEISHISFCYMPPPDDYEELTVSKTAVTSYTRTHKWDIDKSVRTQKGYEVGGVPKIWLYIDGQGNEVATWVVAVTYKGYEDSEFNVRGVITIKNTGTLPAVITSVDDKIGDTSIDVVCRGDLPYTLPVGDTLFCGYSKDFDSKVGGPNVVWVTTGRDRYGARAAVNWGDPTKEVNATVHVLDESDLFGTKLLGTVDAPNSKRFAYSKSFAWADYGKDACGSYTYGNTAKIYGDNRVVLGEASATLKVNVQCYIWETAYAKGNDAVCFIPTFANWGWTNPIGPGTYNWPLWAGAGRCDTSKGTQVGTVTVVYNGGGYVTVTYNVAAPYTIQQRHVYAGYDMFPKLRNGRSTVAPGSYTNVGPFKGEIYVIAHAVVGIPDPNFGP